jgi:hypothetical protein
MADNDYYSRIRARLTRLRAYAFKGPLANRYRRMIPRQDRVPALQVDTARSPAELLAAIEALGADQAFHAYQALPPHLQELIAHTVSTKRWGELFSRELHHAIDTTRDGDHIARLVAALESLEPEVGFTQFQKLNPADQQAVFSRLSASDQADFQVRAALARIARGSAAHSLKK